MSEDLVRLVALDVMARRGLEGELSVTFVGADEIHCLNRDFLGHDYETDCLTFDLADEGPGDLLGEVIVNIDQADREADERGLDYEEELLRYVVHGVLHLAGEEDDTGEQKSRMSRLESEVLRRFR